MPPIPLFVLIVQARNYVINGEIRHVVYSSFERVDPHGFVRDFVEYPRDGAIANWLEVTESSPICRWEA